MSLFNKARFITNTAAKKTGNAAKHVGESAQRLENKINETYKDADWYKKTTGLVSVGQQGYKRAGAQASQYKQQFSDSEVGRLTGKQSRRLLGRLQTLPILSLQTDTLRERHGVPELIKQLNAQPDDPLRYIWLAEAIARVRQDTNSVGHVRDIATILTGHGALHVATRRAFRESAKQIASLGSEGTDTETALLMKAFFLSWNRVKAHPADSEALHLIARVYSCRGFHQEAIRFSKLALQADKTNKLPYLTLTRSYMALEHYMSAELAAGIALKADLGLAHKFLADLALIRADSDTGAMCSLYDEHMSALKPEDYKRYWGTAVTLSHWMQLVGNSQRDRLFALFHRHNNENQA
ncbi:tetratricopeptide repeat protein [Salinisphaera hydrothermalis]|uniref:tetratricopeptide repeat protein n=1 Tax=Salinisphaera hydrothermalis TaxID=563188 RepID=UPI0033414924